MMPWTHYDHAEGPQGERRCPMAGTPCRQAPDDCPYHHPTEGQSNTAWDREGRR